MRETLTDVGYRHPDLPFVTKISISLDIAGGIKALHNAGIVHGDVKPDNIFLFTRANIRATIADFSHSLYDMDKVTTLIGTTAGYTAPEWKIPTPAVILKKSLRYRFW